jgi:hypothetical protein
MDDSTFPAVLAELHQHLIGLADWLRDTPELDLATAEITTLARVRDIGGRLLEAGLAARGAGDRPDGGSCACGHRLRCEGTRPKEIQTLLGWITVRRRYYRCATCKVSQVPLDQHLGLHRDSHSAGVRRLASRCGALLPFAQAASTLREAAGIQLSASTVRTVTEGLGAEREDAIVSEVAAAWEAGWGPVPGDVPARWYVAMDGVRILSTDGQGREAKLGMVVPVHQTAGGERRGHARYTASFEAAEAFGRRLAMLAHHQQVDLTDQVAVLGDGAAWIWTLAEEHLPGAVHIVDWYHARERVWELGRALYGPETAATATWVERQLNRLAAGEAATLAAAWQDLPCRGEAAQVREAQVTYFTNQTSRMAYDQYRAAGWDIGSGMIESACKAVIGQREKGAGMRWSEPGAQAVTNVRLLLFNDAWSDYWTTAA